MKGRRRCLLMRPTMMLAFILSDGENVSLPGSMKPSPLLNGVGLGGRKGKGMGSNQRSSCLHQMHEQFYLLVVIVVTIVTVGNIQNGFPGGISNRRIQRSRLEDAPAAAFLVVVLAVSP